MKKNLQTKWKAIVASMFLLFSLSFAPLVGLTSVVHAQSEGQAQQGVNLAGGGGKTIGGENGLVPSVINILSWIIGVASVIMIIIGGLRYVTSSGEASSISSAKNTILYALVGLVVALFAQAMVNFVLGRV